MKKNTENGNEIGVSRKNEQVVVVELGLKLHQQQDQDRSFLYNHDTRRVDHHDHDDANGGPSRCNVYNTNNNIMMMMMSSTTETSPIYSSPVVADNSHSVHSSSTSTTTTSTTGVVRCLQPFDAYFTSPANPFLKSSGGMAATAAMGFPFTAAQWKELERQAMIYKYMMASLPVPPDLLYSSFPTHLSPVSTLAPASYYMGKYGSGISMRWSGNSKDAEPGRCRRTDGKKWRCSRDVAPNQKYCERHMHRGRPRSRKHVEQQQQHQNSLSTISNYSKDKDNYTPPKKTRLSDPSSLDPTQCVVQPSSKISIFDHPLVSPTNPFEDSRNLGWNDEQQWSRLVQTNMNTSVFQQQFEGEPLNLNSHAGYNPKSDELGLLERPLIDAWSMGVAVAGNNKTNGGNGSKHSLSSSNGGNSNVIDDDMCQIHMGLGLIDSWVSSSTTPGGPLAEVLRPGNQALSDVSEVEFITPPATAVSSPSGVLQKTLATFSDSSGSNSPTTCHNSKANSDMPFQWLN